MEPGQRYATWAQVNLSHIEANLGYYQEKTGRQIMAVVKANAYGHGAVPVSQAALSAGATWLAVARVDEALELRAAGIEAPILLLGFAPPARFDEMIAHSVSMALWEATQMKDVAEAATRAGIQALVHLKVDTGMSRLGVQVAEAEELALAVIQHPQVSFEGLFTHLARADSAGDETTLAQLDAFQGLVASLERKGARPPLVHCANSAAGLNYPDAWYDLIRLGIAMYGMQPSSSQELPQIFKPGLTWRSTLAMVKTLPPGRGVSYGHDYITTRQERIGTVPVGYADGYRRTTGNEALVGGRKVSVVGRVTMDQIMLQLDAVPDARVGDEVVLLGTQGEESLTAEALAIRWGTINYEVTSGIERRVPRVYI